MPKFIVLILAILMTAPSIAEESAKKAFLLGHTSGLDGDLSLLPFVQRSNDPELKRAYAQTLVLKLNSIKGLNPDFSELDAAALTPLCEAATLGVPFLAQYAPEGILTKSVVEYLTTNKEGIVSAFSKLPLAQYSPSPCAEALRESKGKPIPKRAKGPASAAP